MSIPKRYGDNPITKRLYSTWCGIKTRCYNPNFHAYKYYGGKGVKLYNISANSLRNSLDADKSFEEAVVYHREHFVTLSGETHSVTEWAKITGIPRGTLSNRLRSGKTPEEVLRKVDYRGKLV